MPKYTNLLTITEKAEELGTTGESLRRWRLAGVGPRYVQYGALIRYFPENAADTQAA